MFILAQIDTLAVYVYVFWHRYTNQMYMLVLAKMDTSIVYV